jgi:hypothetical protein
MKRATASQEDADRKLASAAAKEQAADEAPQRAAVLVKQAADERKKAQDERAQAQTLLDKNRQLVDNISQRQKQAIEAEKQANRAKAEAEKLLVGAKQADALAQAKEEKAREVLKDATKKLQQAKDAQEKSADTLMRIESAPGLKALLQRMTSKIATDRKEMALLLKSLGPGLYPEKVAGSICLAVSVEKDNAITKAMLDALAVVEPELAPPVVSLMLNVQFKETGAADFGPWNDALKRINALRATAAAPVLRLRLRTLLKFVSREDVGGMAVEIANTLADLAPDEASVKAIADVLAKKLSNADLQERALAALVKTYPKAQAPVCAAFGRLANGKDADFLIKLAKAAVGLGDKRLARELSPLRFHASAEVRAAAEAVFRLEQ